MDFLGLNPVELHQYEAAHPDAAVFEFVATSDVATHLAEMPGGTVIGGQPTPLFNGDLQGLWVGTAGGLGGLAVTVFGLAVEGAEVGSFGGPVGIAVGALGGTIAGTIIGMESWNVITAGSTDAGKHVDDTLGDSGNTTGLSK